MKKTLNSSYCLRPPVVTGQSLFITEIAEIMIRNVVVRFLPFFGAKNMNNISMETKVSHERKYLYAFFPPVSCFAQNWAINRFVFFCVFHCFFFFVRSFVVFRKCWKASASLPIFNAYEETLIIFGFSFSSCCRSSVPSGREEKTNLLQYGKQKKF